MAPILQLQKLPNWQFLAPNFSCLFLTYLGSGGGTGRGGKLTLIAARRLTTFLRLRTTGTGGFFKCSGLRGGGGGGGSCALASANVHEATAAIKNTLIVFIVVGLIIYITQIAAKGLIYNGLFYN